jgi:hypothetical protein
VGTAGLPGGGPGGPGNRGGVLLDEQYPGPGRFLLLSLGSDPAERLDATLAARWRALGGVSAHVGPGGLTDADSNYAPWFDALGARVVLIRPDFHVFGTAPGDAASTNVLVADLLRRVTCPSNHAPSRPAAPASRSRPAPPASRPPTSLAKD